MSKINENLNEIKEEIKNSLSKSAYSLDDICIVAVTKSVALEQIKAIYDFGIKDIGENRVQKLTSQINELNKIDINWHYIGHLQSNKVKYLIDKTFLIQSLDRHSLAKEINKRAQWEGINVDTLLQVNVALEQTKFGLSPDSLFYFIEQALERYSNIRLKGLMTIAPYDENPEVLRPYFYKMRQLFEESKEKFGFKEGFNILSMGMSNDYKIALEEGSNMIRIGSLLFK